MRLGRRATRRRRWGVRSGVGAGAAWQLECSGATYDLGPSALAPIDDLVVEIAIDRRA
jgi:hypothetical protein